MPPAGCALAATVQVTAIFGDHAAGRVCISRRHGKSQHAPVTAPSGHHRTMCSDVVAPHYSMPTPSQHMRALLAGHPTQSCSQACIASTTLLAELLFCFFCRKRFPGFVLQGTHTAMRSGIMAANAAFDALTGPAAASRQPVDLSSYAERMTKSSVYDELHQCRNIRPG